MSSNEGIGGWLCAFVILGGVLLYVVPRIRILILSRKWPSAKCHIQEVDVIEGC